MMIKLKGITEEHDYKECQNEYFKIGMMKLCIGRNIFIVSSEQELR